MLVTCRECAGEISDTAQACPRCGAPASVAFVKQAAVKERSPEPSRPKPTKIQTRPGLAQGLLGKAMAWFLLVYAILGSIGIATSWFNESAAGESVGYRVGQGIGVLAILLGAWRGIMLRENRAWFDWVAAVFLLFIAVAT